MIFGYVTALAPSYEVFAASRLLVGLMNGGIGLVCFVLTQEYVGKSYWAMTGTQASDRLSADSRPPILTPDVCLCRDAEQHDLRRGHRSVRSSGILHPALEDSGHGGQLFRRPLLPDVCVSKPSALNKNNDVNLKGKEDILCLLAC